MKQKKVLAVYIEPSSYIMAEIERISYKCKIDIVFLKENATQNWNIDLPKNAIFLKSNFMTIFKNIFLKRKYALFHVNGWSHWFCLFLILSSRMLRIPCVIATDTSRYLKGSLSKKYLKKVIYPILFSFPLLFFPGGTRQSVYLQYYGVPMRKICIAQMTVDVEGIQSHINTISSKSRVEFRQKKSCSEEKIIFLFVGRLLELKGLKELVQAFKKLSDEKAQLWIVGEGELRTELEGIANGNAGILFWGRRQGNELIDIYDASDVVVLPSHYEQWGLTVNEGMAAGKALIVTEKVGCVDDLVFHEKNGLVVKEKQVDSLYASMKYMLENPDKRKAMAEESKKIISKWTMTDSVNRILDGWGRFLKNNQYFKDY